VAATVTVVEYMKAIGGGMDDDLAKGFQKTLQKQGMEFKLGQKVNIRYKCLLKHWSFFTSTQLMTLHS
jgi:pyruvate/2-oxoglutarate dehydrogenase complex dihydrolipoamide dehydrogenase (E3) component